MRRRLRRELGNSDILQMPWYRQAFYMLELPFILVRNATIPPVEQDSWSQAQAAVRFLSFFFVATTRVILAAIDVLTAVSCVSIAQQHVVIVLQQ